MRTPTSRTGRLALGTAAALLTAGAAAAPAIADGGTAASEDAKQASGQQHLVLSPASGGAGTHLTIKATCRPAGGAASEALKEPVRLSRNDSGQWVGTGQVKNRGLQVGRAYPVRVTCVNGAQQTANFTYTASPSGGASAGFGGSQDNSGYATAIAIGGGVAVAGAVGYVFTARRRSAGNHYY
jgi:hypothetical protein